MNKIKGLNLVVPDDWQIKKLESLVDFTSGGTPRRDNPAYWEGGNIPWLKSGELNDGFIYDSQESITALGLKKSSAKILKKGTLLYALYGKGTVSKTGMLAFDSATNQAIAGITPKNTSLNLRFLQHFLIFSREKILGNFVNPSSDTGRTNIYINDLKTFKIPLPSLKEQEKIVFFLSKINSLSLQTNRIIKKLQLLKKGLMQRLFTQGIGHTEFKETRLGRIPKDWEIYKVNDIISKMKSGGTPLTRNLNYYEMGTIPFVKIEDLSSARKYLKNTKIRITEEGLNNSNAWIVPTGCLLFAIYGSLGVQAINKIKVTTNQAILGIIFNQNLALTEFYYYWFEFWRPQLQRYAITTTQPNLSKQIFEKLKVVKPSIEEQKMIIKILTDVDNKIENEINFNIKLKVIKKGLMQELLTGKKRV